jgi:hypothetical protein
MNNVSLNVPSGTFDPMDNESLGGNVPWAIRPLGDASLNNVPQPFGTD